MGSIVRLVVLGPSFCKAVNYAGFSTGGARYLGSQLAHTFVMASQSLSLSLSLSIIDSFSTDHRWVTGGAQIIEVDWRHLPMMRWLLANQ